ETCADSPGASLRSCFPAMLALGGGRHCDHGLSGGWHDAGQVMASGEPPRRNPRPGRAIGPASAPPRCTARVLTSTSNGILTPHFTWTLRGDLTGMPRSDLSSTAGSATAPDLPAQLGPRRPAAIPSTASPHAH